jgi:catechol 2,3-dioxygenase-like lactoylglutathione lyase family enzyme
MRVAHFGLAVQNLDRAIDFYRHALDFELVWRAQQSRVGAPIEKIIGIEGVETLNAYMSTDGLIMELIQLKSDKISWPSRSGYDRYGWKHLAFAVDDIDARRRELEARDVVFRFPTQLLSNGLKMCYFDDCEGNMLELLERPRNPLATDAYALLR